jgi:predicted 3-demethylubiquinone-9 3-methyltransferase (glyoxalase superfamily)
MQKIIPHLWYDKEAKEAVELYVSLFPNSKITHSQTLHGTPSGDADVLTFELGGCGFMAISAGPYFKFNPAISLLVACESAEEVDKLWAALKAEALMDIGGNDVHPFADRYGWCKDKYGLTWQFYYKADWKATQKITPQLMFTGENAGKAEEAMTFYTTVFKNSKMGGLARYPEGMGKDSGTIMHGAVTLEGQDFYAMDSAADHKFTFNEAVSLLIRVDTQEEIDYYSDKLSAVPQAEQCGWLKDKYGVSWQVSPTMMETLMSGGDQEKIARVTQAFLKMKRFNLAELQKAADGN